MIGLVSLTAARSSCDEVKNALTGVMNLMYNCAGGRCALEMRTYRTVIGASDYGGNNYPIRTMAALEFPTGMRAAYLALFSAPSSEVWA
jgi:hypothetical protein